MSGNSKPTHGKLIWFPVVGKPEVKMENQPWALLNDEKKRLKKAFPSFYGNKKKGELKLKYLFN